MPKHRTPEESVAFRSAVFAGIAANKEVKDIAAGLRVAESYIYTVLRRSGYEKMLLAPTERFVMKQFRTNPKAFTRVLKFKPVT